MIFLQAKNSNSRESFALLLRVPQNLRRFDVCSHVEWKISLQYLVSFVSLGRPPHRLVSMHGLDSWMKMKRFFSLITMLVSSMRSELLGSVCVSSLSPLFFFYVAPNSIDNQTIITIAQSPHVWLVRFFLSRNSVFLSRYFSQNSVFS